MVVEEIPIKKITLPEMSLRDEIDQHRIDEMAQSIKSVGLLQPIRVRSVDGKYLLINGMRRLKAFQQLGRKTIRAEIDEGEEVSEIVKDLPIDQQDQIKMIIENYQRVKGDEIKEAEVVSNLYDMFYKRNGSPDINGDFHTDTTKAISGIIGVSETWVRDRLNIHRLTVGAKIVKERMEKEEMDEIANKTKKRIKIPIRVSAAIGSKIRDEEKQMDVMEAVAGLPTDKAMKVVDTVAKDDVDPYEVAAAMKEIEKPKTKLVVLSVPTEIMDECYKISDEKEITIEDLFVKIIIQWWEEGHKIE